METSVQPLQEKPVRESARRAKAPSTTLAISGMTCGNCARHVTEALQSVPTVQSASVSLDVQKASVRWKTTEPDIQGVLKAVEEAGYSAKVEEVSQAPEGLKKMASWHLTLWVGVAGTAVLMIGEWVFGLAMTPWFRWLAFAIATVVQVFAGAPFYRGAWTQLKLGRSNMDTLVALGSTTAYAYSAWALLAGTGHHLYFMEAAAIISLISLGHWLEARMSVRASGALRQLLDLAPAMARRLNADGTEMEVPARELDTDDLVVLKPGDRVPTDARVVEGQSAMDESMLTGESIPVDKGPGASVYAGTTNMNGRLVVKVTATGEETALAQIIAAVQRAQTSRADIQRLGDRISSVFVPVVVSIAIAAALWWGLAPESARAVHAWFATFLWPAHVPATTLAAALIIAASVLIIACPCAMGLATPAAIMAGSNAAASRGILIRDGVALEKAGKVSTVLFDKTGTLTYGKPQVAAVWDCVNQREEKGVPELASSLAAQSNHPLSQAIAGERPPMVSFRQWREVRGAGIEAEEATAAGNQRTARLGSANWLSENGVDLSAGAGFVDEWTSKGATVVGVARNRELVTLVAIKDAIKTGAPAVVQQLRQAGLRVGMVTGDNRRTAAAVAKQAGIESDEVFAEVRPEHKAELVQQLQSKGERIAFVGDGINDAPALEQADLGIAVARASDVAREAADIILLRSEIEAVPESLGLARATLRTIHQNLFWAFFYNSVGVPLAALGFLSPILCAAAMGFSDMIVIGNALRLRRWKHRELR